MLILLGFFFRLKCLFKLYVVALISTLKYIFTKKRNIQDLPLHTGKVAIVTGGDGDIGLETAKSLVSKNVHTIIASKDCSKGKLAKDKIREEFPNSKVDVLPLDLSSFDSIKTFVQCFTALEIPLHLLINNAGVMLVPEYKRTENGFETHFQVNYLGHFYLTCLLLDKLHESASQEQWSRIINVGSVAHFAGTLDITTINSYSSRQTHWALYSPHGCYADSKVAVAMGTLMLSSVLKKKELWVTSNVVHPGICNTHLYQHVNPVIKFLMDCIQRWFKGVFKTSERAGAELLFLALSADMEKKSGGYYEDMVETSPKHHVNDKNLQETLWNKSQDIIRGYELSVTIDNTL